MDGTDLYFSFFGGGVIIFDKRIKIKKEEQRILKLYNLKITDIVNIIIDLRKMGIDNLILSLINESEDCWIPKSDNEYKQLVKLRSQLLKCLYDFTVLINMADRKGRSVPHNWKNILRDYLLPSINTTIENYKQIYK